MTEKNETQRARQAGDEWDAGLQTPTAYEEGAGRPVPGSPVWEDAQLRERVNEAQRKIDAQSAQNPDDPEPRLNEVETVHKAAEDKSSTATAKATAAKQKAAADKAATDKAAAEKTAKGEK